MSLSRSFALLVVLTAGPGLLRADTASLTHAPPAVNLPGPAASATGAPAPGTVNQAEVGLVAQFDRNGDGRLDTEERRAARAYLQEHPAPELAPPSRPGEPPALPVELEPAAPGRKIAVDGARAYADRPLYDPTVVRSLFLEFADPDWEQELIAFAPTDVQVPARVTLDGRVYPEVGAHFQAQVAESALPAGYKRSLELNFDFSDPAQRVAGQRQLRLRAAATDPTFLRTMLYHHVAAAFVPAPQCCYLRVVINGEDWGIYTSTQPLDDGFIQAAWQAAGGARWLARPGADLEYLGDDPAPYRAGYRLLTPENPAAWAALIRLCKTIHEAKAGEFETTVATQLDLDGALRFFAVQNALINQDGYGGRSGGYGLFLDPAGRFHLVPQDAEASFRLVQVAEYDRPQRGARGRPGSAAGTADRGTAAAQGSRRNDFPKQAQTNLAMLLSTSFVNKADSDFDEKVTREEWQAFARSWFIVMDEDYTGRLSREQFIAKARQVITPPSLLDGRTRETFGGVDAAGLIGGDLFTSLDADRDGRLTQDEMVASFGRWFDDWRGADPVLKQPTIQAGLASILSRSVFSADQSYIAAAKGARPAEEDEGPRRGGRGGGRRGGGGGNGGDRGGYGGSGMNVGPLHLGLPGRRGDDSRTLVTFGEELDALAGADDEARPLLRRLLAAPGLRDRYLAYLRDLAQNWLAWSRLGPVARQYHDLIADEVRQDTHKATSYEKFVQEFDQNTSAGGREGDATTSLKAFVDERGDYLRKDELVGGAGNQ
ncbi:MAG TPA: CotH kinase family protein [Lacunisphaera sp.]|nr:CotH kinase family protein [Lacunisphaera sp.]